MRMQWKAMAGISISLVFVWNCSNNATNPRPAAEIQGGNPSISVVDSSRIVAGVDADSIRILVDDGNLTIGNTIQGSFLDISVQDNGLWSAAETNVARFLFEGSGGSASNMSVVAAPMATFEVESSAVVGVGKMTSDSIQVSAAEDGVVTIDTLEAAVAVLGVSSDAAMHFGKITSDTVRASVKGQGAITVASGQIDWQIIEEDNGSSYNASGVIGNHAVVVMNGDGSVRVRVSRTLEVRMEGTGSVSYYGSPVVSVTGSGTGSVTKFQ